MNGKVVTDLHVKPTDSHAYLNYHSHHPPHVFQSTVYSQAIRYRRIISDHETLKYRLNELKTYFLNCNYPNNMVSGVISDVLQKERCLEFNDTCNNKPFLVPWVVTYGPGSEETKEMVKKLNVALKSSPTFKNTTENESIIQVVCRRAANIKDLVYGQKCLGKPEGIGISSRCTPMGTSRQGRPCDTCNMMSEQSTYEINGLTLKCEGGNCLSKNIVYFAICQSCIKDNLLVGYFGKTVTPLRERVSGHRNRIKDVQNSDSILDDSNSLATHAFSKHKIKTNKDFNTNFKFSIGCRCDPKILETREQHYINKYKTYHPLGLNMANPIGLPGRLL